MAQITAPIILDSTGQQIVTALNTLSNNVKPTADQIKRTSTNNQTVEAALTTLNSQSAKKAEKRIAGGESAVFTFSNYQTTALFFCAAGNTNAALYIYSNGYLAPVATDSDVTVTLSQDYKTVTVTNPTSSRVFHVGCVSSNLVPTVT